MDLTLLQIAQTGIFSAMDMGFNAVEVERWIDPESFKPRLAISFGDQEQMRKPRMRTPCEWALTYSEEAPCIRAPRQVEIPIELIERPVSTVKAYLIEQLLELA